jgi:YidC/Oxa1 family membrane protein insertase
MFDEILIQPLANGLIVCYRLLGHNLGLAIIGFSLVLRFILNPLTKPYMESMKKMKELAPQLEKLKKKHGNDRVKLAQAQSELYKQRGVNPGSGCLPYLLQIVVLIAFFNVFTRTLSSGGDITQKFNQLLYEPLKFKQDQTINTKFLYMDVAKPDVFDIGLPFPIPGPVIFLAAFVQLLSSKMMAPVISEEKKKAKTTKNETDDIQVAMQQSMTYTFPLLTLFFGLKFPSGLALYWFLFSLWQLLSQYNTYGMGALKPWLKKLGLAKEPLGS